MKARSKVKNPPHQVTGCIEHVSMFQMISPYLSMVQGPTDVWQSPRPGHQHPEDVWRQVHRRPDGREEESQVWHEVSTGVWPMFKTLHAFIDHSYKSQWV